MNLQDFALLKEDAEHYTVGHPKGRSMTIAKKGLSHKAQDLISKLKREQHFDEGGEALPSLEISQIDPAAAVEPQDQGLNIEAIAPESQQKVTADAEQQAAPIAQQPQAEQSISNILPTDISGIKTAHAELSNLKGQLQDAQEGNEYELPENHRTSDDILQSYAKSDQAALDAYKSQKLDPNRYFSNMSTGSKIASGLGLLVSGLGAGLTGSPNMASKIINDSIDRDIEAQKNDQSKEMNLWKMNRERMGSELQADLMTKNQLMNVAKYKMEQARATTQNITAQSQLTQTIQNYDQQMAMNRWMMSRVGGGAPNTEAEHVRDLQIMQQVKPELYKDEEAKYLPGYGRAKVPLTKENRDAFQAYDDMEKAVNDAKAFQAQQGKLGALPFTENAALAQSKGNAIALAMNKLNGLNRLNETEYHAFQQSIGKLGASALQSGVANAQLDELSNQIARKRASEIRGLGVVPFKQHPQAIQAINWLKANPNHPDAAGVRAALGAQAHGL